MHEIKPIGGYLEVDENGFIIKKASLESIQEKWKPIIDDTVEAYKKHFDERLIAVYIRGSVAKGEAVDYLSDLDTIAIVQSYDGEIEMPWSIDFNKLMVKKYPFIEKVELLPVLSEQANDPDKAIRIMLKTQSVCVFGKDISDRILPIKIGKEACQHIQSLQSEISETVNIFENGLGRSDAENQRHCTWIMKRIIRTGFELVMEREQKYTRELYPSFESFAKYYPEKRQLMHQTLELALNPVGDSDLALPVLREWASFMPSEIERIYGFNKT